MITNLSIIFLSIGWLGLYYLCPKLHLSQYRYSANNFVPYSDLSLIEEAIKKDDLIKADEFTRNIIFNLAGTIDVNRIAQSDIDNFPCAYLIKIDEIWMRTSNHKYGFTAQSQVWDKNKVDQDPRSSEKAFQKAVGWSSKENSSYPNGYFPHKIYKESSPLAVPFSSDKLHSCQQI